jgi:DNA-binding MarR family transcriptional regulator
VPASDRVTIDGYVVDALMPDLVGHDRSASAFVVYLYLWRRTRGGAKLAVVSHRMLADGTGLAKRSVQAALQRLERRGLIEVRRATPTSASTVTLRIDWR